MFYYWDDSDSRFSFSDVKDDRHTFEITDEHHKLLFDKQQEGYVIVRDDDGRPCWTDAPPPSPAEQVAQADAVKSALQREAEFAIKPLERAKSLGIATPQELALLTEWEKYSVYLMRVDTSTAPNITWPVKPAAV